MMTTMSRLQQRNQEIGSVLTTARKKQRRTIAECAEQVGTSRRRYKAIEDGEVAISLAEVEVLSQYLELPLADLWRDGEAGAVTRQVVVEAQPGEVVQILLKSTS